MIPGVRFCVLSPARSRHSWRKIVPRECDLLQSPQLFSSSPSEPCHSSLPPLCSQFLERPSTGQSLRTQAQRRGMLGLVETKFAPAGKLNPGDRTPSLPLNIGTRHAFLFQRRYLGIEIVTHQ